MKYVSGKRITNAQASLWESMGAPISEAEAMRRQEEKYREKCGKRVTSTIEYARLNRTS